MRNREQVVWDFVQAWLTKAENDLKAAELLFAAPGEFGDMVGFHCQQAVEKFVKAYLVRYQIEFPKTHEVAFLRTLVSRNDERLAERLAFADWLTPFGVEIRYPGQLPAVDPKMAERALADAKRVRHLVLEALDEYLKRGRPA
jgi:HEPN domain-containing protein|uniref:HEPN domain-containing protein n=1 Tax=Desulfomonile tiedjei TaxID=2358 RepID=A0A7C4ETA2_9BACT